MDYDSWPFARHMAAALDRGQIRVWCLGLGVDPLTYATDLLTVAVIDSRVFDELFSLDPRGNDEGSVLAAREFAAHVIDRVVTASRFRRPAPRCCGWRGGTATRSSTTLPSRAPANDMTFTPMSSQQHECESHVVTAGSERGAVS